MRHPTFLVSAFIITSVVGGTTFAQQPLGTAFTYQGSLRQAGAPVNGTGDFQCTLWDALSGGAQMAGPVAANNVTIAGGLFTASIDFGGDATAFNGSAARWLQIAVRSPAGSGTFTTLSPRQPLAATPFALQTRGLFVNSAGNLGIGTTAPQFKLHIANGDLAAGAPGEEWYFHPRSHMAGDFLQITDYDAGVPQFQRGLVLRQNGNVGIGITNPAKRLTVAGSMEIGTTAGDYQHLRIGGGNSSGFLYGSFPHFGDGIHIGYNYYADAAGANQIPAPSGGTSRISMGYGYVALATVSAGGFEPFNKLVVDNSVRVIDDLIVTNPNGGDAITATSNFSGFYALRAEQTTGNTTCLIGIASATGGSGIGVSGQSNSSAGWDFWAGGAGVNYGAPSSIRWKRNIEIIDDPLQMIQSMRGVFFDWDADHGGHHDVGFIGEEVGRVLPQVVVWEENGDFVTGMDYSKLTPLLVEAVKALRTEKDAQIANLQAQNQALQDDNHKMRDRLAALEAAVARLADHE